MNVQVALPQETREGKRWEEAMQARSTCIKDNDIHEVRGSEVVHNRREKLNLD